MVLGLDSQRIEQGLRQMEVFLQEFATSPVPNYQGFLLALSKEDGLGLPGSYFAAVIARKLNRCEQLIAEDQRQGNASEEGFQAYLQYKLLIRLLDELSPEMLELIESFQRGDYDKDIVDFNQVIELANRFIDLAPEEGNAYSWRGHAYFIKGDHDKAIESYTQAINLGIEDGRTRGSAYSFRGTAYFLKGAHNLEVVMADFDKAVCLVPNSAAIYLTRGDIYEKIGDYNKAIEDYDNAVRLCPDYEANLVDSKFNIAGYDLRFAVIRAIELLERIYPWPPESATGYYYTGVRSLFNNDGLSAGRCFEMARGLGYDDQTKIQQHLANLEQRK